MHPECIQGNALHKYSAIQTNLDNNDRVRLQCRADVIHYVKHHITANKFHKNSLLHSNTTNAKYIRNYMLGQFLTQFTYNYCIPQQFGRVLIVQYIFCYFLLIPKGKKGKGQYSSSWEPHLRATGCHLPYHGITQYYLPPDTSERAPRNSSHAGWYSIYLPRRDGRLS